MKESLSSSTPRSGEVEEDEELEPLDKRCRRRDRDMVAVFVCAHKHFGLSMLFPPRFLLFLRACSGYAGANCYVVVAWQASLFLDHG